MLKVERLEKTVDLLPNLDCGSCGSPNCRAFAEDIVRGLAVETDCVFKLRERVRDLAGEMKELAEKLPPSMEGGDEGDGDERASGNRMRTRNRPDLQGFFRGRWARSRASSYTRATSQDCPCERRPAARSRSLHGAPAGADSRARSGLGQVAS